MKNFAILCSIVYCGIFCHTLYSQNITDSAITAVKDMQVDTVDNVTVKIKRLDNNYIYEAEALDFALHKNSSISSLNKKKSQAAWAAATNDMTYHDIWDILYGQMSIKDRKKLRGINGYIIITLTNEGKVIKYSLGFKFNSDTELQIFSTRDCIEIFQNLNNSLFNPWNEDIDKVSGTIGLPAEDNP